MLSVCRQTDRLIILTHSLYLLLAFVLVVVLLALLLLALGGSYSLTRQPNTCVYIYIYIQRERYRYVIYIYICMLYIYIYIHICELLYISNYLQVIRNKLYFLVALTHSLTTQPSAEERYSMVQYNMLQFMLYVQYYYTLCVALTHSLIILIISICISSSIISIIIIISLGWLSLTHSLA